MMSVRPSLFRLLVASTLASALALACSEPASKSASVTAQTPPSEGEASTTPDAPALPVVSKTSQTLIFTFVDERGRNQAVSSIDDVPDGVKQRVYVTDLQHKPAERMAHKYAFFTDLTRPLADGTYPVTVVSRYKAAKGEDGPPLPAAPKNAVVLYSAEWCGYCKKAKSFMTKEGIPFLERDVEKTPGASRELQAKLKKAGMSGGGVPVLDVKGQLVVGYDPQRIQTLWAAK